MKLGLQMPWYAMFIPTSNQVEELTGCAVAHKVPVDKLKTKPHCFGSSLEDGSSCPHTTIGCSSTVMG